ncbi:hypothetical protein MO973_19435 [Paenibacillus sp. TRM 82003]|nr:hypothetical protein [Paenibacillus sp. TRM 82003]
MANGYRLRVEAGRIEGEPIPTPGRTEERVVARWEVPIRSEAETRRFVEELAADPLLAGRWQRGAPTEADRKQAGADERGWRSCCDCGMRQPCRHAQSTLFQLRTEAKRDPWIWLAAAGVDTASMAGAIRKRRAEIRAQASDAIAARAARRAVEAAARQPAEPPVLGSAVEPAFWNRDLSFADWLRPIMAEVRKKEEQHDVESDQAVDSYVRERA